MLHASHHLNIHICFNKEGRRSSVLPNKALIAYTNRTQEADGVSEFSVDT